MRTGLNKPLTAIALSILIAGCSNSASPETLSSSAQIFQISPTPSISIAPEVSSMPAVSSSPVPSASKSLKKTRTQKTSPPDAIKKSPVPTKEITTSATKKPLPPARYDIGREYLWEDDPFRFGLAYTTLQPVETGISWAIFKLKQDQVLLVRAVGPYRSGYLYTGVNGFGVVEVSQLYGTPAWHFFATCQSGEERVLHIMGKTWTKDEHPETFSYSPLEESAPCLK